MTDQALDYYEELLKRGRELYELVRPQYIQQIRKRLDAPYLLLALFERHLAQRVREQVGKIGTMTENECPQCHRIHPEHLGHVLYCDSCGYCSHPSTDDGVCECCGKGPMARRAAEGR